MAIFTVLHNALSNFSPRAIGGGVYAIVAHGPSDRGAADSLAPSTKTDSQICEFAFEATNHIKDGWHEVGADRFGLIVVDRDPRSTSVGDIVRIEDTNGLRYYVCDAVGWKKIEQAPALRDAAAASCSDTNCRTQTCPEHAAHAGADHTYEQHHDTRDHVGEEPCRCTG